MNEIEDGEAQEGKWKGMYNCRSILEMGKHQATAITAKHISETPSGNPKGVYLLFAMHHIARKMS